MDKTLVICEKPTAAGKIAAALAKKKPKREEINGVSYYEFERDGKKMVVVPALGHLFTLKNLRPMKDYPIYDIGWVPAYEADRKAKRTQVFVEAIRELAKDASGYIVASVDGNELTPIVVDSYMKLVHIGDFVDEIKLGKTSDIYIPSIDWQTGKILLKPIKGVSRHRIDEPLYEIFLPYGRRVKITSSHSVFTIVNGKICLIKGSEIRKGTKLLIPLKIPRTGRLKTIDLLEELMAKERNRPVFVAGEKVQGIGKRMLYRQRRVTHPVLDKRVLLTKKLGGWLKARREEVALCQTKASALAGISQASISNWENGKSIPTLGKLQSYLKVLGIPIEGLFERGAKLLSSCTEIAINHAMKTQWKGSSKSIVKQYARIEDVSLDDLSTLGNIKLYSKYRGLAIDRFVKPSRELFALIGYFLAEGSLNNRYRVRFHFGPSEVGHEKQCVREVTKAFQKIFGIDPKIIERYRGTDILIDNYVIYFLFAEVFGFKGQISRSKRIPSIIFNATKDLQLEFLRAYFLGDGYVSNLGISFSTASKELANELVYLLLQNGVVAGVKEKTLGRSSFGAGNFSYTVCITHSDALKTLRKVWSSHHLSAKVSKASNRTRRKPRFLEKIGPHIAVTEVKDVRKVGPSSHYVYDLSVEGENFICGVGGVCCHNTDFDVEGSLIGRNVLKYVCGEEAVNRAKRMKFSTLTAEDLCQAYEQLMPRLDFELINAGIARHVLDWYWGMNVSLAMSAAVKAAEQRFAKLSAGRVQTPSVDYEEEILVKEDGRIKTTKIGEVVDRVLSDNTVIKKYGCEIAKTNSLEVPSFNPATLKVEFHPVKEVVRHQTTGPLFEIKLESGRKITVTPNHSVFTLKGTSVVETEARNVNKGDYLVCPRRLRLKGDLSEVNLLEKFSTLDRDSKTRIRISNINLIGEYPQRLANRRVELTAEGRQFLRKRRTELGFSMLKTGHPSSTLSQWETGKKNPRLSFFVNYLEKLGIQPLEFLYNYSYVKNTGINAVPLLEFLPNVMKPTKFSRLESDSGWELPLSLPMTPELLRLLGYFTAEGCYSPGGLALNFGVHEKKLIKDAMRCIRKIFGNPPRPYRKRNVVTIVFGGKVGRALFSLLGAGGRSKAKRIPWIVFNVEEGLRLEYFKGLLEGDGSYAEASGVGLLTASSDLACDLMYTLLAHDILAHSTSGKDVDRYSKGLIYRVWVCEKNDLLKISGAIPERFRERMLRKLVLPMTKTGIGGIPVKALKVLDIPKIGKWKERIAPNQARKLLEKIRQAVDEKTLDNCEKLISSDLAFLRVVDIKETPPTNGFVYDFSVDGTSNFICGFGGVCAHNTLKILVEREREIMAFKPEPFWVLSLLLDIDGTKVVAEHATDRFFDRGEAERVLAACKGKPAKVSTIQTRQYQRSPPVPFDLGLLQSEAYRCFGYTPMRTQQIAQALYHAAFISYPRTSSQKLPLTIGYAKIIEQLGGISKQYKKFADELLAMPKLIPNEGKKTDPAHPSVYPTGEKPEKLVGPQQKLYDLIVRRFFSVFGKSALVESMKVELDVGGQPFLIHGRRVLDDGWLKYYGPYSATEEIILPQLSEGQELGVKEVKFEEKETQPPPRYNPASIIKEMEARNLGTEATRGPILQNIYERGYIFGNQITVTDLGIEVVDSLLKHCPEIVSEELTARFEREMEAIQEGKHDKEQVIVEARAELDKVLSKFRQHQLEIGKQLAESYRITRMKQRIIGKCPKCGGDLKVVVSRATHKRFVGCSNYPKCTNSFPLPQIGMIISLERTCEQCGVPMVQVNRVGMRPYRMCLDPKCPSKADWGKKKAGGAAETN